MSPPFRQGLNPRAAFPAHRERGPKRYSFILEDIARASGAPMSTVRRAICRHGAAAAEMDPADLGSVCAFILRERKRRGL